VFVGSIAWALGAGFLRQTSKGFERGDKRAVGEFDEPIRTAPVEQANPHGSVSPDFVALIDAINAQARASRKEELREEQVRTRLDQITIIIIAVTATAAFLQVREMIRAYEPIKSQAEIARTAQRAWVGPVKFSLANPNDTWDPLKVIVTFQNFGHVPARNVRNFTAHTFITNAGPVSDWQNLPAWKSSDALQPKKLCSQFGDTTNEMVVYPNQTFELPVGPPQDRTDIDYINAVKDQQNIYVVDGCFSYESFDEMKFSSFCALLLPVNNKGIGDWTFGSCPIGNDDF
jgi:hypothetical protein